MIDLLSAVITLEALEADELDRFQGRALHALFWDLTARADARAAQLLHDKKGLKPFTSSNLGGLRAGAGGRAPVAPGERFRWRVTVFEERMASLWSEHILPALPTSLKVGEVPFRVAGWTANPIVDGCAGATSYAELVQAQMSGTRPPDPWVNLHFVSPTAFRSEDVHVPLPIPALVMGHWLEKWNAFAPEALHLHPKSFAEHPVVVDRYDLHTEPVIFGKAKIIGFVGQCSLLVLDKDPYWNRLANLLAAYGFWCGTGHRTPYGLGQTRIT